MKTINIGVVGLGYWGPNLLRNFLNTPGCRVKYGCDLRQEALNKLKLQHPTVKFTNRYGDILNGKDVDAVVIATPVSTHFELAKSALLANKHVLLEKPMASSAKECEELIEIAGKRNLILMMDYTFLYTGAIRKIKEIIDSKELGKIIYFDSERINLGLIQDDINVIWDLAPHDISIMNYIFEEIKPISIFAIGTNHINKNFEEMAHITIKFDSGAVGHIHVSWLSPVKIRKILIGGTKKMILYDDVEPSEKVKVYDKEIFLDLAQETPQKPIYRSGDVHTPKLEEMEALKLEVEHFIRCVNKEEVPLVDGRAGLGVVKILEACDKSLKLMNKNITSRQIVAVIKKIKTYNIKTRGSFIFGYPKESALDILKTFWLIFKSGFEIHELVFSKYTLLYPKTSINKYLPENFDWHKNYSESELKQVLNVPVYMPPFDLIRRRFTLALFWFYVFYKGFTNLL